jgi:hypothetical protein
VYRNNLFIDQCFASKQGRDQTWQKKEELMVRKILDLWIATDNASSHYKMFSDYVEILLNIAWQKNKSSKKTHDNFTCKKPELLFQKYILLHKFFSLKFTEPLSCIKHD